MHPRATMPHERTCPVCLTVSSSGTRNCFCEEVSTCRKCENYFFLFPVALVGQSTPYPLNLTNPFRFSRSRASGIASATSRTGRSMPAHKWRAAVGSCPAIIGGEVTKWGPRLHEGRGVSLGSPSPRCRLRGGPDGCKHCTNSQSAWHPNLLCHERPGHIPALSVLPRRSGAERQEIP